MSVQYRTLSRCMFEGLGANVPLTKRRVIMYCLIVTNGKTSRELNMTANTRKRAMELRAAYLRKIVAQGLSSEQIKILIIKKGA